MAEDTGSTPPEWKLVRTTDGRVRLLWARRHETHDLDLGTFDDACEAMTQFLSAEDFGERQ